MCVLRSSALVVGIVLLAASPPAVADSERLTITSPQRCPDGLTIKSRDVEGAIEFDVTVDADKVAHAGELYKGRVHARATLQVVASGQQLARVEVQGTPQGATTRYQFSIARAALIESQLQFAANLYEKSGFPTLGGGVSLRIPLSGFAPPAEPVK